MNEGIQQKKIILFDGVCNLCNRSVIFVLQREKEPVFQFASIKIYDKGTTINPGWDYLLRNKVRCLVNAGKQTEAINLLKKMIEKHEGEPEPQKDCHEDLARLYWSMGNKTEAMAWATKSGNKGLVKFFMLGDCSMLQKKVDEKYEELRKNGEYISQLWMGIDYARAGAREKALECFNDAIALKDVAITLLLTGHYDFMNIKYLSMALMTRKLKMLVNF